MWPNPQETADLVTFTEEFLNGKFFVQWSLHPLQFGFYLLMLMNDKNTSKIELTNYKRVLRLVYPAGIYIFKVWRHFGVFIVKFEQISHTVLVFRLFTLNK